MNHYGLILSTLIGTHTKQFVQRGDKAEIVECFFVVVVFGWLVLKLEMKSRPLHLGDGKIPTSVQS